MDALMDLIKDLKAKGAGKTDSELVTAQELPAQGAILSGFRRGRKLHGLSRAARGRAYSGESIDFSGKVSKRYTMGNRIMEAHPIEC